VVGGPVPDVIASKLSAVGEAASRCGIRADRTLLRDLASEVEWAKVSQVAFDSYEEVAGTAARPTPGDLTPADFARVYAAYEQVKRNRSVMDFEDVLLLTAAMIDDDRRMAASVRDQYRSFLVDEYQDVNPVQHRLPRATFVRDDGPTRPGLPVDSAGRGTRQPHHRRGK
jgi:DNA helicase-2/ATP-dependent DNA helicase PcrA